MLEGGGVLQEVGGVPRLPGYVGTTSRETSCAAATITTTGAAAGCRHRHYHNYPRRRRRRRRRHRHHPPTAPIATATTTMAMTTMTTSTHDDSATAPARAKRRPQMLIFTLYLSGIVFPIVVYLHVTAMFMMEVETTQWKRRDEEEEEDEEEDSDDDAAADGGVLDGFVFAGLVLYKLRTVENEAISFWLCGSLRFDIARVPSAASITKLTWVDIDPLILVPLFIYFGNFLATTGIKRPKRLNSNDATRPRPVPTLPKFPVRRQACSPG